MFTVLALPIFVTQGVGAGHTVRLHTEAVRPSWQLPGALKIHAPVVTGRSKRRSRIQGILYGNARRTKHASAGEIYDARSPEQPGVAGPESGLEDDRGRRAAGSVVESVTTTRKKRER